MSRSKNFVIAAIAWLPLLALGTAAQAQTVYNATTDWKASYGTTTAALAATSATWGTEAQNPGAWSAGVMSWNWTNMLAGTGDGNQILTSYYTPNTVGVETSGATVKASFTYTVPFQTYQLNPGQSFQQAVGTTFTEQVASGFKPEKNGGSDSNAITLPSGITSAGAATGLLNEVGAVKANNSITQAVGFTTSAFNISNTFSDGDGSVRAFVAGVFYDYATTNSNSTSLGGLNAASASATGLLTMEGNFGPSYLAWTAPLGAQGNGTAVISLKADELSASSDGSASLFVMSSAAGPTAPLFSVLSLSGGTTTGWGGGGVSDTTGGTSSLTGATTLPGGTLTVDNQITWTSGTINILPGEVLYFVDDTMHVQSGSHGNHSTGDGNNPAAVAFTVTYTPEPSSFVLLGMAGVGLAAAAYKRRRAA